MPGAWIEPPEALTQKFITVVCNLPDAPENTLNAPSHIIAPVQPEAASTAGSNLATPGPQAASGLSPLKLPEGPWPPEAINAFFPADGPHNFPPPSIENTFHFEPSAGNDLPPLSMAMALGDEAQVAYKSMLAKSQQLQELFPPPASRAKARLFVDEDGAVASDSAQDEFAEELTPENPMSGFSRSTMGEYFNIAIDIRNVLALRQSVVITDIGNRLGELAVKLDVYDADGAVLAAIDREIELMHEVDIENSLCVNFYGLEYFRSKLEPSGGPSFMEKNNLLCVKIQNYLEAHENASNAAHQFLKDPSSLREHRLSPFFSHSWAIQKFVLMPRIITVVPNSEGEQHPWQTTQFSKLAYCILTMSDLRSRFRNQTKNQSIPKRRTSQSRFAVKSTCHALPAPTGSVMACRCGFRTQPRRPNAISRPNRPLALSRSLSSPTGANSTATKSDSQSRIDNSMDDMQPDSTIFEASEGLRCLACGRRFAQSNAYSVHMGSCRPQRKRMASALQSAQEDYGRKKARTNKPRQPQLFQSTMPVTGPTTVETEPDSAIVLDRPAEESPLSLAEGRPRRENRPLPLRFRNDQPTQLPSLPPNAIEPVPTGITSNSQNADDAQPPRQILKSLCNIFGLFRQYHAVAFPSHDPDAETQLWDVSDLASEDDVDSEATSTTLFQPYPNKNAFLLGEWYWNGGLQKTKDGFKKLINIVGDKSFDPADVTDVSWDALNKRLGESNDSEDSWLDQPDAGWFSAIYLPSLSPPKRRIRSKGKDGKSGGPQEFPL
ncbi:hypothetical protein BDZ97DRAFT_1763401 [Flammula alnicola]|nr:hypothetical protein BDZ97DRAFT_1763401 [Flammula alnicola]